jgi:outer membrane protein assembly factor BamB
MRILILLFLLAGLSACSGLQTLSDAASGITNYFSGGEDNSDPPHELIEYTPEIQVDALWKESTGDGTDEQLVKLVPAVDYGKVLAADRKGLVNCRDSATGRLIWEAETDLQLSAGPALSETVVVAGSSDAEVVALNLGDGSERWKVHVSSEVLTVPVIADGKVLVRTTDGTLFALDEKSGAELWRYEHNVPPLSVRGAGKPLILEDHIIDGYDNGKLMALQLENGKFVWEASLVIPKGRSEVERLIDLDADPIEVGGVVFTAGVRGGIGAVSGLDGDVLWRNEDISSYSGLSHDYSNLYLTNSESDVIQLDQRTGRPLWKQKELHQRKLTGPAYYRDYVVVGDFQGYVHWLSTADGHQLGRIQVSDAGIEATPVVVDDIVYVYAQDGTVAALKAH